MNHHTYDGPAVGVDAAADRFSNRQSRRGSLVAFALGSLFVQALTGCGSGNNDRGVMVATSTTVPTVAPESGDAWQGRYVGTVKIDDIEYFGDALLTADGLIRLYVGGAGGEDGTIQETAPTRSAQLVGTLNGQMDQISGDAFVFGQECAVSEPIRFCTEVGHATLSIAVVSQGAIQGEILVTTSISAETWSLNLTPWTNYYSQPTTQGGLAGHYHEQLAEFSISGDIIISIAADGSLSFPAAGSGCEGNGQSRPHLAGAVSVYDVSLIISGCQAPHDYLNGAFSGLASVSPSDYWGYDDLLRMWLSRENSTAQGSSVPALTLLGLPL